LSFERSRDVDEVRATRLESPWSPQDLLGSLVEALNGAADRGELRITVDSKRNAFTELRAIVQFQVTPELYDWFFNARTGYRAQFWIDPKVGLAFNRQIVEELTEALSRQVSAKVRARRIEVTSEHETRQEEDTGMIEITRDELLRSLAPDASKIWMGERLYSRDGGPIRDIGFATLSDAAQNPASLCVPRWAEATNPKTGEKGEGLRAPFPCPENSWLDLKGGFLDAEGNPTQIKPQDERANHIHEYGWT
jgi:hypothetical protein